MKNESKRNKTNCLDDLKRRILTEALEPGTYLDEMELADEYGISRPPLREVLRQLAGEGYVVLHENRGTQVAPMSHKSLRNFFIVAPMIYAAVGRLAAQNATVPQIGRLKDAQRHFRDAIRDGNGEQSALANERFHSIMGEMADNEFLVPSLRRLLIDHTRIGMTFYNSQNDDMSLQRTVAANQHDEFIALIETRNGDGCAELAVDHWELSRTFIESFVSPSSIFAPLGRPLNGVR